MTRLGPSPPSSGRGRTALSFAKPEPAGNVGALGRGAHTHDRQSFAQKPGVDALSPVRRADDGEIAKEGPGALRPVLGFQRADQDGGARPKTAACPGPSSTGSCLRRAPLAYPRLRAAAVRCGAIPACPGRYRRISCPRHRPVPPSRNRRTAVRPGRFSLARRLRWSPRSASPPRRRRIGWALISSVRAS